MNKINTWVKHHPLWARAIACVLVVALWSVIALIVNQRVLLPTPWEVIVALIQLVGTAEFWLSLLHSLAHIALGFILASVLGVTLGLLSARYAWVEALLWPIMNLIKTVPVASFIIIALIWIKSEFLSIFICFLMVLPIIYTNCLSGIQSMDHKLIEMARVFHIRGWRRIQYLWIPQMKPYLLSAAKVSLGLSWKAGIAAEVIAVVAPSIGGALYDAKIYLETPELFAWTLTIVILSVGFEKLIIGLISAGYKRLEAK